MEVLFALPVEGTAEAMRQFLLHGVFFGGGVGVEIQSFGICLVFVFLEGSVEADSFMAGRMSTETLGPREHLGQKVRVT